MRTVSPGTDIDADTQVPVVVARARNDKPPHDRCVIVNCSSQPAMGTLTYITADTRFQTIMMRRLGKRSTQAPADNPKSSHGSHTAAARSPTCKAIDGLGWMDKDGEFDKLKMVDGLRD